MWLLLTALAAQAQDCPNPEWIANQAEEYVLNFVLEDAADAFRRAEEAFACSEPAEPKVLARLLNAEGTMHLLQEHGDEAAAAYGTAHALAADVWKSDYGAEARAVWEAAERDGVGKVDLLGVSGRVDMWVDGTLMKTPAEVPVGPHLVQVGPRNDKPAFARWVVVVADEIVSLRVDLPEQEATATVGGTALAPPRKSNGLLTAGIGVAAVGVGTGLTTWALNRDPDRVVTEGYESGMKVANVAGWGLAGVGAGLGVVGVLGGKKTAAVVPTGNGLRLDGRF